MVGETYDIKQQYDVPYVPSSGTKVATMMKLAQVVPGEMAVDIGSGEGKLVIEMAKRGAYATGIEIDEQRSLTSRARIAAAQLETRANIFRQDFWEHDLNRYDLIMVYGVPSIMERLGKKIENEAKPTVRVVTNHFEFPGWLTEKSEENVYLYRPLIKRIA
ncbi:MAG TPA: class I SAM-dependent methyltransferase [Candidatus Saccharimonadales bacterium]|nr:class I SAM-dependent methyltransferase [Candidatus Saccharimonadales bacterium]